MTTPEAVLEKVVPAKLDFPIRKAHLLGICGSGMKPLAQALIKSGAEVSGSDPGAARDSKLGSLGARLYTAHDAANLDTPDVVVFSSAIAPDNPELAEARRRGIRILHRSEMLAWFLHRKNSILIAGTHGKTTTTAMATILLEEAGFDPWGFIGGRLERYGGNLRIGGEQFAVAEADESDGSFLELPRDHAIVTNIEAEHLNYWQTEEALLEGFHRFCDEIPVDGSLVACVDDPGIRKFLTQRSRQVVSYGLDNSSANYTATNIETTGSGSVFTLEADGRVITRIRLSVPGRQNIANALATYALAHRLGADVTRLAHALESFRGVDRRFTRREAPGGFLVIDDYGHHPTEIAATMAAARMLAHERGGRLYAVFQPHRYTRTQNFFDRFGPALAGADHIMVMEVYGAGEPPIDGISGRHLSDEIRRSAGGTVEFAESFEDVQKSVGRRVKDGDIVLLLGAGTITNLTDLLCPR